MRNLIVADVQDITRIGLISICSELKLYDQMIEVDNKAGLINKLLVYNNAIVIVDYTLFDFLSVTELQIIQERFPKSDWVLFSDELSNSFLKQIRSQSLQLSIILKNNSLDEIKKCLITVSAGQEFICQIIKNQLKNLFRNDSAAENNHLTHTEIEILKEIALGKTTKEIASTRNLSFHTITTHRKNIFRKLEVNNVHEATKYAIRAGIIDTSDYYI